MSSHGEVSQRLGSKNKNSQAKETKTKVNFHGKVSRVLRSQEEEILDRASFSQVSLRGKVSRSPGSQTPFLRSRERLTSRLAARRRQPQSQSLAV